MFGFSPRLAISAAISMMMMMMTTMTIMILLLLLEHLDCLKIYNSFIVKKTTTLFKFIIFLSSWCTKHASKSTCKILKVHVNYLNLSMTMCILSWVLGILIISLTLFSLICLVYLFLYIFFFLLTMFHIQLFTRSPLFLGSIFGLTMQ